MDSWDRLQLDSMCTQPLWVLVLFHRLEAEIYPPSSPDAAKENPKLHRFRMSALTGFQKSVADLPFPSQLGKVDGRPKSRFLEWHVEKMVDTNTA